MRQASLRILMLHFTVDSGTPIDLEISLACLEQVIPTCSVSVIWSRILFCRSVKAFEQTLFRDSSRTAEGLILDFSYGYLSEKVNTFVITANTFAHILPSVG